MRSFQVEYPDALPIIMNQSPEEFEREAKMAMVTKLYEMGKLTSGQAAKIAGISRVQFLLNCHRYGVASVIWDEEELQKEFEEPLK